MSEVFTIKVVPKSDEVFIGYVARLAYRNGFMSIRSFLRIVNITHNKSIFRIGTTHYNKLATALAAGIQMDVDAFKEFFKEQQRLSRHINKYVSATHINRLRICPKCFLEDSYIKDDWMQYHTSQCIKHKCNLINECPKCHRHFNWSGSIFKGCDNCGTNWKEIVDSYTPVVSMSPLTYKLNSLTLDEESDFFDSFYYYLQIALRPYDAEYGLYKKLDESIGTIEHWNKFLNQAYELYSSQTARENILFSRQKNWLNHCGMPCSSGKSKAIFQALDKRLKSQLMQKSAFVDVGQNDVDATELIEASPEILSFNKFKNRHKISPHIALSPSTSAKLLATSIADMQSMIDKGHFEAISHHNNDKKRCGVNLKEILRFHRQIDELTNSLLPNKMGVLLSFQEAKARLPYKRSRPSELLSAIINGSVRAFAPNVNTGYTFRELKFCPTSPLLKERPINPTTTPPSKINDNHVKAFLNYKRVKDLQKYLVA